MSNVLWVGEAPRVGVELCPGCNLAKPADTFVRSAAGRGMDATKACLSCAAAIAIEWRANECSACDQAAERIERMVKAHDVYRKTGQVQGLPELPTREVPAHREGCKWKR